MSTPVHRAAALAGPARCRRWAAALMLVALAPVPLSGATYSVGSGAGCTHANLAAALAAADANPGDDTIRLLSNSSHQGPFQISTPLVLEGGYATCTATTPTGSSTLLGATGQRVLTIFNTSTNLVELRRLLLVGGSVTADGGGVYVLGTGSVVLRASTVTGNQSQARGGGLFVLGTEGTFLQLLEGTTVASNSAQSGGGLGCLGAAEITIDATSAVANNSVTGDGGGAYLTSACRLISSSGGFLAGIAGNLANGRGGGIYADSGSSVTLRASDRGLADLGGNQAGDGGGVYVSGLGTAFRSYGGSLSNNTAGGAGGALYAADSATAYVTTGNPALGNCLQGNLCSLVAGNHATNAAAIHVRAADALVFGTYVRNNVAGQSASVGILAQGGSLAFDSSLLIANQGLEVLAVDGAGSQLTLANVTLADNPGNGQGVIGAGSGNMVVRVLSSVVSQGGALFARYPSGFAPQVDCLLAAQAALVASLPPAAVERAVQVGDPRFVHPASGNYHLGLGSPAIDACDESQYSNLGLDFELEARTYDDPDAPEQMPNGWRDLGADEVQPLFADGFESGTTSAWTLTVP